MIDPDGTPLGDARHVLSVLHGEPDSRLVFAATVDVYGPGETTGISLGDFRTIVDMAIRWDHFKRLIQDIIEQV